jgi:hypothetical protein
MTIAPFFRAPPIRDAKRLKRIREIPCLFCGAPSVAAHFRAGVTGMGKKPNDDLTAPLCPRHHEEQHLYKRGELKWWLKKMIGRPDLFIQAIRAWLRSL